MNKYQKCVVGIGAGLIVGLLLYVPWEYHNAYRAPESIGYRSIFSNAPPNINEQNSITSASINYTQVRMTIGAVLVAMIAAFLILRNQRFTPTIRQPDSQLQG